MATSPRRTTLRKAVSVGAVALGAMVLGAGAPAASAAPAAVSTVTSLPSLDTAANWAIVKAAAAAGYVVPAKLSANCGITRQY